MYIFHNEIGIPAYNEGKNIAKTEYNNYWYNWRDFFLVIFVLIKDFNDHILMMIEERELFDG